jgi:2-oxoglutarate ferredoxin oxidoreductase subunit gamma
MDGEIQVRLGGSGGQGLQLSSKILAAALLRSGLTVALSQSYEPTSRGGVSQSDLVVGDGAAPIDYPLVTAIDYLVLLDEVAAPASLRLVKAAGVVLGDAARVDAAGLASGDRTGSGGGLVVRQLPFTELARALGNERIANIIALGALIAAADLCPLATVNAVLRAETPPKFLDMNVEALAAGYRLIGTPAAETVAAETVPGIDPLGVV